MIEAVTVCVDYADFLAETLPLNKVHFDRYVVVTSVEDEETQRLCEYHHIQCVTTDFGPKGEFRKADGINAGLSALSMEGWVVHLDADIVLPPLAGRILRSIELDQACLYGVDRLNITSYEKWRKHCRKPMLINNADTYVHLEAYPPATRFMAMALGGWVPIGFFQMWCPVKSHVYTYPSNHTTAGRTDMLFAAQWERAQRQMIPEVIALHLESEEVSQGANWAGRTTRPFRGRRIHERIIDWWRNLIPELPDDNDDSLAPYEVTA